MVRIAFVHPDLGIGGAERLVVDAGLALKSRGHVVHFFTSHHDKSHCFEETRNGSLQVTAVGDWLPRHCFGYFYAFWAYVRMIYVSLYLVFFSSWRMDVVFCDQVSVCIPVLKLSKARIVFYCHFPDLLLTQRKSLLKRIYRAPLDWLEEVTTGKLPTCIWVMGVQVGRWWGGVVQFCCDSCREEGEWSEGRHLPCIFWGTKLMPQSCRKVVCFSLCYCNNTLHNWGATCKSL